MLINYLLIFTDHSTQNSGLYSEDRLNFRAFESIVWCICLNWPQI